MTHRLPILSVFADDIDMNLVQQFLDDPTVDNMISIIEMTDLDRFTGGTDGLLCTTNDQMVELTEWVQDAKNLIEGDSVTTVPTTTTEVVNTYYILWIHKVNGFFVFWERPFFVFQTFFFFNCMQISASRI